MPDGVICTHHVWIVWRSAEKADGDGSMTQPSTHKEMLYTLQGVLQRPSPLEPAVYDDGSTLVVDRRFLNRVPQAGPRVIAPCLYPRETLTGSYLARGQYRLSIWNGVAVSLQVQPESAIESTVRHTLDLYLSNLFPSLSPQPQAQTSI